MGNRMKISGKIVDVDNLPISSANIVLRSGSKSGRVGTISNFDGEFNFESDDFNENDIFEISYIGFVKQTFIAKELKNKKIVLKESIDALDEVILVGTRPKQNEVKQNENKIANHFSKNKFTYAGATGLLGLGLILLSIKKI
jgi:hypothetical protein